MRILNRQLTIHEFSRYLSQKHFGKLAPDSIVLHHSCKYKLQEWNGHDSLLAIKTDLESKGHCAGPHIVVSYDGIWLFTDMYNIGTHGEEGDATYKHLDGRIYRGHEVPSNLHDYGNFKLQNYSIGIIVIGDYDLETWNGETKRNALYCVDMLIKRLQIPYQRVYFHREFTSKTCPGKMITKDWLFKEIANLEYAKKEIMKNEIILETNEIKEEYKIQIDPISVERAKNIGILSKVDSLEKELIAIASMRTIDYMERRIDSLENKIKSLRNSLS